MKLVTVYIVERTECRHAERELEGGKCGGARRWWSREEKGVGVCNTEAEYLYVWNRFAQCGIVDDLAKRLTSGAVDMRQPRQPTRGLLPQPFKHELSGNNGSS